MSLGNAEQRVTLWRKTNVTIHVNNVVRFNYLLKLINTSPSYNKGNHNHEGGLEHRFWRFYFSVYSLVFVSIEKIHQTIGHVLKPETTKRNHRNERNEKQIWQIRYETTKTTPQASERQLSNMFRTLSSKAVLWRLKRCCIFVCILSQSVLLLFSLKLRLNCLVREEEGGVGFLGFTQ